MNEMSKAGGFVSFSKKILLNFSCLYDIVMEKRIKLR